MEPGRSGELTLYVCAGLLPYCRVMYAVSPHEEHNVSWCADSLFNRMTSHAKPLYPQDLAYLDVEAVWELASVLCSKIGAGNGLVELGMLRHQVMLILWA